jgi:hypothetical protein
MCQPKAVENMELGVCVYPKHHAQVIFCDAGFRPGRRSTFVSAKVGKVRLAVAWPFGCPARFADTGGEQTRYAQTGPAN